MAPSSDFIKTWIASEVSQMARTMERRGIPHEDVTEITTHEVSQLQTQIRVKTKHNGVRYFIVKVSEQV